MEGYSEGQHVWVEQDDGSQRAAVYVGEAKTSSWLGGAPGAYVVYDDTRSGAEVALPRITPRQLPISHHERVPGREHRWHVHLHGRSEPVAVELPEAERSQLDLTDEEIHDLLPTALQRHAEENRDVSWDSPVRVMQTHFTA